MKLQQLSAIFAILCFVIACEHEPFPSDAFPSDTTQNPMDTSANPNDTTGNPIDTNDPGPGAKPCDPDTIYFERDLLPLFKANCAIPGCHNAASAQKGVIMDNYFDVINSAEVSPGDLDDSELWEVITETDPDDRMPPPPAGPLPQAQIQMIQKWILQGAKNLSCDDSVACVTQNQSFANDIQPIFNQFCVTCHSGTSPRGGQRLTNHSQITNSVNTDNLIQRINHQTGFGKMPPGNQNKMDQCKIDKIVAWVSDGMPNN